tara:strand:- start:5848 stop:6942 length:1095 start_codon:yes stop_codon:yes gene_type:complete
MAVFLNKKEQVYDLKLTSYGKRLLSNGTFKPTYYAFFDDNILYDGQYAGITESQNDIHKRIKEETPYIEGLVLFHNIDSDTSLIGSTEDTDYAAADAETPGSYFLGDVEAIEVPLSRESKRYDQMIGDAFLEGDTNVAPGWKIVSLDGGRILSSSQEEVKNNQTIYKIPQVNVELNYQKKIVPFNTADMLLSEDIRDFVYMSRPFKDRHAVQLIPDNLMLYVEELNTALLTENFDLEIFEIVSGSTSDTLKRKYFPNKHTSIKGGMIPDNYLDLVKIQEYFPDRGPPIPSLVSAENITTSSVSYYFVVNQDNFVDRNIACRSLDVYNKKSYYIDVDFECDEAESEDERAFVDIYGEVTEPEICQ